MTKSLHPSPIKSYTEGTDTHPDTSKDIETYRLTRPGGRFRENLLLPTKKSLKIANERENSNGIVWRVMFVAAEPGWLSAPNPRFLPQVNRGQVQEDNKGKVHCSL